MADLTDALADGPLASDGTTLSEASSFVETVSFSEAWAYLLIPGGVAGDTFRITESFALNLTRNVSVVDQMRLTSLIGLAQSAMVSDGFEFTDSFMAWVNALLRDGLKLTDLFSPSFVYNLTITQALKIIEALDIHAGLSISDQFVITDALALAFTANAQIVETIGLAVNLQENLVMRIAFGDHMTLSDAEICNFIYSETITESFVAEIVYQSPDGNVSTWAINTRTNAVTEYSNFAFNSYANMGMHKYIAADSEGLYELIGSRDLTTDIIATFGGGYFQPNGAKFAGLKGVYIGAQGQGNYLLKIVTGDGIERVYRALLNPGLMTTKVNMGKGIRSRYIAWELINEDGQDFDFDSIEFVPMMSGRRV